MLSKLKIGGEKVNKDEAEINALEQIEANDTTLQRAKLEFKRKHKVPLKIYAVQNGSKELIFDEQLK